MHRARLLWSCCLALAAPGCVLATGPDGDREPVDPAEQRVQTLPPPRPAPRGNAPTWISRGPAPTQSAQVRVPPDNEVCGAIQAIAAHPTDPAILYIGAVNGGIWKTTDATAARPSWTALGDTLPSLSISALAFDPTDGTRQTLVAGTGRVSNFAQRGDDEIGVYRSTDGGASWTTLGGTTLLGQKLVAVSARGPVLMAASRTATGGLFRSVDTGANWTLVSGTSGLPTGVIGDLVGDPGNPMRFYISVLGGAPKVLRSDDGGASWNDITAGLTGLASTTGQIRPAVGANGVVYLAVVNSGRLAQVARSPDLGANWTAMDVPAVHPGAQGVINTAIAADPADPNLVYISGDRITASPFTGNVVRGNFALPAGSQFTPTMDAGGASTAPHADSRAMAFDANGNLLQADDGGIYRRSAPTLPTGTWGSVIGNLNVMEVHDLAHDRVADILVIGTQDNGTHMQIGAANPRWTLINGGDGGDVAIDDRSLGQLGSFRFISSQNLGGFRRARYDWMNIQILNITMPNIPTTDQQFVTPLETNLASPNRLLVGGLNNLYESTNADGATPTLSSLGSPGANRNAMTYGARNDPGVAYVGKNAAVFRRNGNAFVATATLPAGAAAITDVVLDPDAPLTVYAIDDDQVFRSTTGGDSWQDITANLPQVSSKDFRSIEFIADPGGDRVVLGTRSGVYESAATGNASWSLLGSGLPDVLVFDLRWLPASRTLVAGTLGRGVWSINVEGDGLLQDGFE